MYRFLLLLVLLLAAYCIYINCVPSVTENFNTTVPLETESETETVTVEDSPNMFLKIWNGYYPYSGTVAGNQQPSNFLQVSMKDQDRGVVTVPNNHWMVRSYGPTVLQGDSYDKSSSIYLEMQGDWRHAAEQLPKLNIRVTDNKTGKVTSLSSKNGDNLDAYSVKIVNVTPQ